MNDPILGGVFRDGRDGARARRDHLLKQRRDEYALMPHRVRRVYVRRVARAITGGAAIFGAGTLLLGAWSADVRGLLLNLTPGASPAVLSTCLLASWILIGWVYFAARSFAEDRFARATAKTVRPSGDLYGDLDRLEKLRPDAVAAQMAARAEATSVALPIVGLSMLLPLTAAFLMLWLRAGAFPNPGEFEVLMERHVLTMLPAMAVLASLSWWFARRLRRRSTMELASAGRLGDTAALFIGALLATTFAAAVGLSTVLVGIGLIGFVLVMHLASTRVLRERLAIEVA